MILPLGRRDWNGQEEEVEVRLKSSKNARTGGLELMASGLGRGEHSRSARKKELHSRVKESKRKGSSDCSGGGGYVGTRGRG